MTNIAALKAALGAIKTEDNPAIVKQKSRDFFWYSPVLKRQLEHVTADLVVTPQSEAEVIHVLKTCFAMGVPVTPRGAGTGNYGQAMPLLRGVVLNLAEMNKVKEIKRGSVIAEAGAVLAAIDRETRPGGQELRLRPSTYQTATIGGFIAGGSGGIGSIKWGGLRNIGNVLGLRVVTMEATPRVLDLKGRDLMKVMHAYGTNGIITEVEMPLDATYDWVEVIVGFDDYMKSVRFANLIANQDGLLFKEISTVAAPVPYDYFLRHRKFLKREHSVALLMVAPHALEPLLTLAGEEHAAILFRSDTASDDEKKGLPPLFELTWNHTTLRGLRVDPTDHLSAGALSLPEPCGEGGDNDQDLRGRGAGASRIPALRRQCLLLGAADRALHDRGAARRDRQDPRGERLPDLQPAPLHAGGRRHEAHRRGAARLQARGRPEGAL